MKIIQILPTISYGDAIGNDTLAICDILMQLGFETGIYAENIDPRVSSMRVFPHTLMPTLAPEDILIYHMSTGSNLTYAIETYRCRKIMIYHNITPPDFFLPYSRITYDLTANGIEQVKYLADKFDYCLAASSFNKEDLIRLGYRCPIDVLPIIIPFFDYNQKPSRKLIRRYSDDWINLLFVGRISPNKKQEDVITAFAYYKRQYNPRSRLFLVGTWLGMERYHQRLLDYIKVLCLQDIYFSGHIPFKDILAYYHVADAFICMSEHEGFCVPLLEAMHFGLPIIAYAAAAIPDTISDAGILINEKNPVETAALIDYVMNCSDLKNGILRAQEKRLQDFSYNNVKQQFIQYLFSFLDR